MPMPMAAILTLLLIATPSINSTHSSLLQESVIPSQGTILARFEIELLQTDDTPYLYNEPDIGVLGAVQQTPRYNVSGEAWVDGVWMNSIFFNTSLSDRFIVECIVKKAINMSSYAWVEWAALMLEGTTYDGELPPPDGARIFEAYFENGDLREFDGKLPDGTPEAWTRTVDGKITLVTFAGRKAVKVTINPAGSGRPRAQLGWRGGSYYKPTELWRSVLMYLPDSYELQKSDGDMLFDFHHLYYDSSGKSVWHDIDDIKMKIVKSDSQVVSLFKQGWQKSTVPIPKNQWNYFVMWLKIANAPNGALKMWQNGQLVWDLSGIDTSEGGEWGYIGTASVQLYTHPDEKQGLHKYFDDFIISLTPLPINNPNP